MSRFTIPRIQNVLKATTARLFGRVSAGTGRAEELTAAQVRSLLSVLTDTQIAAAYQPIGNYAAASHSHAQSDVTGLVSVLAAKADLVGGLVPAGQLPSYVDDVIEAANLAAFPATGEAGKIYVALDTSRTYRWSGSTYAELTDSTAVWGSISGTLSNQTDLQTALTARVLTTDSRLSDARTPTAHSHTPADITGFGEAVDDEVASLLVQGTGISLTYNDAANTLTIASTASGGTPGGSSGQVQQNSAGSFGGSTLWTNGNTVEIRNSTAAMILDLFRTYTSATSFEAFRVLNVAGTGTRIGQAVGSGGGTGGASRQLDFGRWNAAGAWTSLLTWDTNDFATFACNVIITGDNMSRVNNTQIGSAADGSGFVIAANGYMANPSQTAFVSRTGQGANSSRLASIFCTLHGVTAATSYYDWRVAAAGATSTTSIMRLLFDGSLSLTGKLTGVAGNSTRAPICFPDGVAPSSPVDGDIWFVGDVMFRRIGGVTKSVTFT